MIAGIVMIIIIIASICFIWWGFATTCAIISLAVIGCGVIYVVADMWYLDKKYNDAIKRRNQIEHYKWEQEMRDICKKASAGDDFSAIMGKVYDHLNKWDLVTSLEAAKLANENIMKRENRLFELIAKEINEAIEEGCMEVTLYVNIPKRKRAFIGLKEMFYGHIPERVKSRITDLGYKITEHDMGDMTGETSRYVVSWGEA